MTYNVEKQFDGNVRKSIHYSAKIYIIYQKKFSEACYVLGFSLQQVYKLLV